MADENRIPNEAQEKHPVMEDATTLTGKRKRHHPALIWLISIVCVAVLCGAGYLVSQMEDPADEADANATEAPDYTTQLIDHDTADVVSVTVDYDGETYTVLNNGDDGYALEGYDNFSLDSDTASNLISRGTTLTTQSTVVENCENLAEFGLEDPVSTFTFTYTDGSTISIELGNKSPSTYYYLKMGGDNTVYTVYKSVATTMMTTLEDLHTVTMPDTVDSSAISYVKLERPNTASSTTPVSGDSSSGGELISSLISLDGVGTGTTVATATEAPTEEPTAEPTEEPTAEPTEEPTAEPTAAPTAETATATVATEAVDSAAVEAEATETTEETATEATATEATDAEATEETATEATDAEATDTEAADTETDASADMTVIELTTRSDDDESLGVSGYMLVQPFEYDVDSEALTTLAENIAAITITSYVGNVSDEGNNYGMDNPIRLEAKDTNDVDITFLIGNKADDTYTYICVDDTGDVYLTESSSVEFARTLTVAGIVDRFANIVNITKVDELDITTADGEYVLKIDRVPETDEEGNVQQDDDGEDIINDVYYFNGAETDSDSFKKLYQEVIGVLVNGVSDDYDVQGDAVVTVTYHLNVEPGELTVEYVDYTRDTYAVRRDGHTYFYINKSKINDMVTALEQYGQE